MSRISLRDAGFNKHLGLTEIFSGSVLDSDPQTKNSQNIGVNHNVSIVDKLTNQRMNAVAPAQKTENLPQNSTGTAGAQKNIERTQGAYLDEAKKARNIALSQMKDDHGAGVRDSVGRLQGGDFEQGIMFAADASMPLVREISAALTAAKTIVADRKASPKQRWDAIKETRDKLASGHTKNSMAMPGERQKQSTGAVPQRFDRLSSKEFKTLVESKPEDLVPKQLEQQRQFLDNQMDEQQLFEGSRAIEAAVNFDISGPMQMSMVGLDAGVREALSSQSREPNMRSLLQGSDGHGLATSFTAA